MHAKQNAELDWRKVSFSFLMSSINYGVSFKYVYILVKADLDRAFRVQEACLHMMHQQNRSAGRHGFQEFSGRQAGWLSKLRVSEKHSTMSDSPYRHLRRAFERKPASLITCRNHGQF
jgi:hypothetical protein